MERSSLIRIAKYLLVGGGTAAFEIALFQTLYGALHVESTAANVAAIVAATAANFLLNRTATFKSSSRIARSAVLYLLLFCFNAAFSSLAIKLAIALRAPAVAGKAAAMCCTVCWNYVLYQKVIFR